MSCWLFTSSIVKSLNISFSWFWSLLVCCLPWHSFWVFLSLFLLVFKFLYWSYWQAITALKKGACLLKYGRRGTPKFCPFRLSNVSFVLFICRFKLILVKVCVCFKYLYLALITLSPYSFKTKLKPLIFLHFILYSFILK